MDEKVIEKDCINRLCSRCDSQVYKSDLEDYSYQCFECDEDLYFIETYVLDEEDLKK
ncbi:hypothetical protein [Exiguobacterium sp. SH5S4]|uniref:hypothetical protein n=1 Tax=Exiguobacterium sp. SH5S4 TaxID=2510961 RepID=UPI001375552F|nr:hypothetical protein [Exiguobacterium sp. SH5S4]